jgi:CDP-glycerol glycerophosphotransferase (TagB/SpsB family)
MHPNESEKEIKNIFYHSNFKIVSHEWTINELTVASDLVVTFSSTASFPAMQIAKPIVSLDFLGSCHISPFRMNPLVKSVSNERELEEQLDLKFEKTTAKTIFLENLLYRNDGQASKRIVDLIFKLAPEKELFSL